MLKTLFVILVLISWVTLGQVNRVIHKQTIPHAGLLFGEVSVYGTTEADHFVTHLAEDLYIPGNTIYSDIYHIISANNSHELIIAGNDSVFGYVNGYGATARFFNILGFAQLNRSSMIVIDAYNKCLRHIDRDTNLVSSFAGRCTQAESIDGGFDVAQLNLLLHFLHGNRDSQHLLFVTEPLNQLTKLRKINMRERTITTMVQLNWVSGLVIDTTDPSFLLVLGDRYLRKVSMFESPHSNELIYQASARGLRDGSFSEATFDASNGVIDVGEGVYVTISKDKSRRLRIIDTVTRTISSICDENRPGFHPGSITECAMSQPRSISRVGRMIYIGDFASVVRLEVFYECLVAPASIENGHYNGNNFTLTYECDSGYLMVGGDRIHNCSHEREWEGMLPVCFKAQFLCPSPPEVHMAVANRSNLSVTYRCEADHHISTGLETLECNIENEWEGQLPVCAKGVQACKYFPGYEGKVLNCQELFHLTIFMAASGALIFIGILCGVYINRKKVSRDTHSHSSSRGSHASHEHERRATNSAKHFSQKMRRNDLKRSKLHSSPTHSF